MLVGGSPISGWAKAVVFFGLVAILFAVALLITLPHILEYATHQELRLAPGSKNFQHWQTTPVPMYIDIYFHNWTNPKGLEKEKPSFKEMGPYRFYEKRTKVALVWHENNTVSFKQTRHWWFDQENSKGTLQDVVTTVNVVALTAANLVKYKEPFEKYSVSFGLTALRQYIETTRTVEELLFRGYSDDLLTLVNKLPILAKGTKVSKRFGWFYQRNGSDFQDGVFNMETGADDLSKVGKIRQWNHRNVTGFFSGDCGHVGGSTGELFQPGLTSSHRLGLFSPDFCRTIHLDYAGETEVEGIPGLRFEGGRDLVDSGQIEPRNQCYCTGECAPPGLLNLTICRQGAPVFISYPHFHLADPGLLSEVEGMRPDPKKHTFEMSVEPTMGFPMDVKGRFQVNLMIEPMDEIGLYRYLKKRVYMPIMWFDQRARLTEELGAEVRTLMGLAGLGWAFALGLLALGLLCTAAAAASTLYQFLAPPNNKP